MSKRLQAPVTRRTTRTTQILARFAPLIVSLFAGCVISGGASNSHGAPPTTFPTTPASTRAAAPHNFARWEKEIAAFEKSDRENPPPKGGLLFIGSSSIRMWTSLPTDYPDQKILNRGFGGSEIEDSTHFADRVIFPYEPKMIYLRAGGNDLHAGKSVEQVFSDYKDFVKTIRAKMPETPIVYISMSPAPARWNERDANKELNDLIEAYAKENPNLQFVQTYDLTITPDGKPREELFIKDKLHFNAEGYKLLAERVRRAIPK
jgi:lysophospholipase L1-like esterase